MKKVFFENSMFLCNYKSIKEFAKIFSNYSTKNEDIQWSVICERKEDLIAIRNQLFFEIDKQNSLNQNIQAIIGISMYTLDSLARNFCATLAATTNKKLLQELPSFIHKPYLDVISQENMLETILQLLGYTGNDSLPLAKQILSLIDTSWPQDLNFIQLILNTQEKENLRSVQEINEIALKQILASYQYGSLELENYSRLQSLVKDYMQGKFIDHLYHDEYKKDLILPKNFLKGHILWISAPEYTAQNVKNIENINEYKTIKPGNFQSIFVNEFKKSILQAQEILQYSTNIFYESKTIITPQKEESIEDKKHIKYFIAENKHSYFQLLKNILNQKEILTILADFDPGSFKETRSDAGGTYTLIAKDINEWRKKNEEYADSKEIFPQIKDLFNIFLEKISLISNEDLLHDIATKYGLKIAKISDDLIYNLFTKNMENEGITLGEKHPISICPRALSFIAGENLPQKIVAAGRAHAPTASSFHVKVLNNAITILRKQGLLIDLPASEMMYRGFWKNITEQNIPIEFWLENAGELKNFPNYLEPKNNIFELGKNLPNTNISKLFIRLNYELEKPYFKIPNWKIKYCNNKKYISITEFEKYIHCPLQYFLSDILSIKKIKKENINIDFMNIGTQMHTIAEQLITRLVTSLGNENYSLIMSPVYEAILLELKDEDNFLSLKKDKWKLFFKNAIYLESTKYSHDIYFAFAEAIDNLWINESINKNNFEQTQERETVKRTFYRFLQIEKDHTKLIIHKKTGVERERSVSFELANIQFSGKIDRIDATPEGLYIIDYKTSKVPKQNNNIVLLPSELKTKKTAKLSAQGALYCLAWAKDHLLYDEEGYFDKIKSFSLYRLKNLDEETNVILEYNFQPPLEKDNDLYLQLYSEYNEYAERLKEGDFYPNPIQTSYCDFCDFKDLCPVPLKKNLDNEESDSNV